MKDDDEIFEEVKAGKKQVKVGHASICLGHVSINLQLEDYGGIYVCSGHDGSSAPR